MRHEPPICAATDKRGSPAGVAQIRSLCAPDADRFCRIECVDFVYFVCPMT
jgi:hypothetical protein